VAIITQSRLIVSRTGVSAESDPEREALPDLG
jgi:hypothetical protein